MNSEEEFERLKKDFISTARKQISLLLSTDFQDLHKNGIRSKLAKARLDSIQSYARLVEFYRP